MSGPVLLTYSGGALGGSSITAVMLNGLGGTAALYVDTLADESAFELYVDGRLTIKERVCRSDRFEYEMKPSPPGFPRTNNTRITPP